MKNTEPPEEGSRSNPEIEPVVELAPEDWQESPGLAKPEVNAREMAEFARTVRRIERMIAVAGLICAAAAAWALGWQPAVGVLAGTLVGVVNFRWLAATVDAVGARVVNAGSRERGGAVVVRGMGRIFLMALAVYGMFRWSVPGLVGFMAGLAVPVLAMMCEAAYELVAGIRRTS